MFCQQIYISLRYKEINQQRDTVDLSIFDNATRHSFRRLRGGPNRSFGVSVAHWVIELFDSSIASKRDLWRVSQC